jgi:hypothetical protein
MSETLAKPQEFNENMGAVDVPTSVRMRRDGAPRIVISERAPRVAITIPTGLNKTMTVEVVDKSVYFHPEPDIIRARWHDVAVLPNERVLVWDAQGALIARFESWEQASKLFKQTDTLKAIEAKLAKIKAKRETDEKRAAAQIAAATRK